MKPCRIKDHCYGKMSLILGVNPIQSDQIATILNFLCIIFIDIRYVVTPLLALRVYDAVISQNHIDSANMYEYLVHFRIP